MVKKIIGNKEKLSLADMMRCEAEAEIDPEVYNSMEKMAIEEIKRSACLSRCHMTFNCEEVMYYNRNVHINLSQRTVYWEKLKRELDKEGFETKIHHVFNPSGSYYELEVKW